jgi:hypothetical protein
MLRNITKGLRLGQTLWNGLKMRFASWNVRSFYRSCTLIQAATKLSKYKADSVAVQEATWGYTVAQLVEALRYKPEGSRLETLEFFPPAALWAWSQPRL